MLRSPPSSVIVCAPFHGPTSGGTVITSIARPQLTVEIYCSEGAVHDEALSRVHTPDLGASIRLPAVRRSISSATDMGRLGIRVQVETHDCGLAARPRLVQVPAQPKTSRGTWRHRHRT